MAVAHNSMNSDHQFLQQKPIMHHHLPDHKAEFKRDMENLVELLSKLNPSAEEFFPSSYGDHRSRSEDSVELNKEFATNVAGNFKKERNGYSSWRRRSNGRASRGEREESIRRTVYVSDIDLHVTEEQLAVLFSTCGEVLDCRICSDPHSVLRFAFVEFADEPKLLLIKQSLKGAKAALNLAGTMLGYYPVKVLPSKTAILPVNPTFLPKSEDEREMCARTVYCTNIDKKASQADVKAFFKLYCGEVSRSRLLGDHAHSTRIAFVEFVSAESALSALNVSGAVLGSLPIRVSPSKTPVRPRTARATAQYQ